MKTERRHSPRVAAQKLLYIHLEGDSGGIVLNVSDGGFGFHAVAPIQQTGTIRFWYSLQAKHRTEGSGELVWTDATKKTGGLRLISPAADLSGFRNLITESTANGPSGSALQPIESTPLGTGEPETAAPAPEITISVPLGGESQDLKAFEPQSRERWISTTIRQHFQSTFGLSFSSGITFLGVSLIVFLLLVCRAQVGNALIEIGEQISGNTHLQVVSQPVAPVHVLDHTDAMSIKPVSPSLEQLSEDIAELESEYDDKSTDTTPLSPPIRPKKSAPLPPVIHVEPQHVTLMIRSASQVLVPTGSTDNSAQADNPLPIQSTGEDSHNSESTQEIDPSIAKDHGLSSFKNFLQT